MTKEMATMQGVVTHDAHVLMQISGKSITARLCNQRMTHETYPDAAFALVVSFHNSRGECKLAISK